MLRAAADALQRKVKKKSQAPIDGGSVSSRLGRGLDFAEVREYQPGDDVRLIDWKVTARSGKAHTKLFVEERERPVLLLVDYRATMRFGTRGMFKCELAARLAAILGWCAVAARDRIGGFVIADDWHTEIRPQAGRRGLMALFRAIEQGQNRQPSQGAEQFAKSLSRLRHSVHGGSTVILLSDFHGFDQAARTALGSVRRTLDILAVHVSDPLDRTLPKPGNYPMVGSVGSADAARQWLLSINNNAQRKNFQQRFESQQATLKSLFADDRHRYINIGTDQAIMDSAAAVLAYKALS
ncbi:MAG: DUF58 domain-containing protein [Granulosicoccus sp.]|nr:DUF58 domain-containing protein [Granulosicoccus sp.]